MKKYLGKAPRTFGFKNSMYTKASLRATIAINRPRIHNTPDVDRLRELGIAFQDAAWDDDVAVVILTGAGERPFASVPI